MITKFRADYFEKLKDQILHEHFDSKEYLKDVAGKSSDAFNWDQAAFSSITLKFKLALRICSSSRIEIKLSGG